MARFILCNKDEDDHVEEHEHITHEDIYNLLKQMYNKYYKTKSLESQLAPQLKGVLEAAAYTVNHPPATWYHYITNHDTIGIARMEIGELVKALDEHKSSREIRKELVHSIAALMMYVE